uniref:Uncharacterized protein n=1 Tax=Tanacetum cinerariifolium TaxID=118510 RepID=A0A699KFI3_TANCI|nr:hypothetical protein [Tanacetum cinerariifolium]
MDTCTALSRRVEYLELGMIAQALEITKLKGRVKKLERRNKVKVLKLRRLQKVGTTQRVETFDDTVMDDVSNQGRMIAEIDQDANVVLEDDKDVANEIITEVVTAASETIIAASTTITATEAQVLAATLTDAPSRVTAAPSKRRKGVAKEDPAMKGYQALKRKLHTEAQARKNVMIYLKNVAAFKIDYFKGMTYNDIRPIFEAKFDSNVAFLQKTKEQIEEE